MLSWEEADALFVVWLAFIGVVAAYVVRITALWHEHRTMERAYRLRLARSMGRAVREAASKDA